MVQLPLSVSEGSLLKSEMVCTNILIDVMFASCGKFRFCKLNAYLFQEIWQGTFSEAKGDTSTLSLFIGRTSKQLKFHTR